MDTSRSGRKTPARALYRGMAQVQPRLRRRTRQCAEEDGGRTGLPRQCYARSSTVLRRSLDETADYRRGRGALENSVRVDQKVDHPAAQGPIAPRHLVNVAAEIEGERRNEGCRLPIAWKARRMELDARAVCGCHAEADRRDRRRGSKAADPFRDDDEERVRCLLADAGLGSFLNEIDLRV